MAEILVTGATGPHGWSVTDALLAAGHAVRALTRDPSSRRARTLADAGAAPVAGDLTDADSLVAAMTGVDLVYAVTTPFGGAGPETEVVQGETIVAAAERVGLDWLVLGSVASSDQDTGVPHFESKAAIERRLAASSVPYTIVAPTYFFENLGDPAQIAELALPLSGTKPLQQLALADLGAFVAAVVARGAALHGARLEVAGDDPTPRAMADTLGVAYLEIPLERVSNPDMHAMYSFLERTGYQVDLTALRAAFPELSWTSFAGWAA